MTFQQKAIALGTVLFLIVISFLFFPIFGIVMAFLSVPLVIKLFLL